MKEVTITFEHNPELESREEHEFECLSAINGGYYHACLRDVCAIIMAYDKKKLNSEQRAVIETLKEKCAVHFKGIRHVKK